MADIVLTGDTSGAITVAAPAVAGTNTLTLPASTGTVITTGDSGTITQGMIGSSVTSTGPAFSAYAASGSTSVTTNTWTKIALNGEEFDTASCFDSTTNYRFTPTVAGYYQINGLIGAEGSGSQTRILAMIRKNGGEFKFGDDLTTATTTGSNAGANALIYMNGSTDYLELWVYMIGTALTYNTTLQRTYFQGYLARAA
jgi:hypothetical protein